MLERILIGSSGESYWITSLSASDNPSVTDISVDGSGNSYIVGYNRMVKIGPSGNVIWEKYVSSGAPNGTYVNSVYATTSGDIYTAGFSWYSASRSADIVKYNTDGASQWARSFSGSTFYDLTFDSSGNIYATGYVLGGNYGNDEAFIAKLDSAGNQVWQRSLGYTGSDYGNSIAVDSSGNVYVVGYQNSDSAGSDDGFLAKYNTSGALQWQKRIGNSSANYAYHVAVDSSANVYVVGSGFTAKFDTSGTILWQRSLGGAAIYGVDVTAAGDVYVVGEDGDVVIAKYNTGGTLQWQRKLGGSGLDRGRSIYIDSTKNILYVTGLQRSQIISGGSYEGIITAKLPSDGTPTGTYGAWTYTSTTGLTDSASSYTVANMGLGSITTTFSFTSGTYSNTNASSTVTVTSL